MATIVRLPKLGLSERGEIVEWRVSPPAHVEAGDVIAVLESDKSAVDIEAAVDGTLIERYVEEGEEIDIEPGRPIAAIGEPEECPPTVDGRDLDADDRQEDADEVDEQDDGPDPVQIADDDLRVTPKARVLATELDVPLEGVEPTGPEGSVSAGDIERFADAEGAGAADEGPVAAEVKATPKAKRLARNRDVQLAAVSGTGPQGAVSESDVRRHLNDGAVAKETRAAASEETVAAPSAGGRAVSASDELTVTEVRERSRLQRTGAERLTRSAREKPHVRGTRTVNVEPLERVVEELSTSDGSSLSLNDLLFAAVVETLGKHPECNAVFEDAEHRLIEERNVGYAVDSEDGLVVPIVKDAGEQSLDELVQSRRAVVDRVLDGSYEPSDLQGGTFTVTNVGALGMDSAFSIINPPEVAILAVGRRTPALFEDDGDVKMATGIELSLLIDHRVLDGGDAGAFLTTLAEYVERPARLLRATT